MKSVGARVGRAVNRVFGHAGPVLDGRYHHRLVQCPLDARHTLGYVLLNVRHHWMEKYGVPPPVKLDAASSGM